MLLIGANELKKKMIILVEGQPFTVLEVTFASPTARSASAMVRARLKHLLTGAAQDKNFKTGEKFEEADVELAPASLLYSDAGAFHFMDETTFEQFSLPIDKIADIKGYLKEGVPLQALKYNGIPVSLQLPVYVELKVVSTEPGFKGDSSGGVLKRATLETGLEARVPLYIKEGDTVRVNTQTGEIPGRA